MNKEIFWEGLENPTVLEKISVEELELWKKEYPFFPLLSALICKKKRNGKSRVYSLYSEYFS